MSCLINSEWTESTFTFLASIIRKLVQVCEYFKNGHFHSYWHIGKDISVRYVITHIYPQWGKETCKIQIKEDFFEV